MENNSGIAKRGPDKEAGKARKVTKASKQGADYLFREKPGQSLLLNQMFAIIDF